MGATTRYLDKNIQRKKLYSPSLTAVTANIRAKRAPTKNLSGLEVRPILERFMKKRVKRASKNPYFIVVG